jgi:hypothetical protein
MARGWESKSIEAQQADAADKPRPHVKPLSPQQQALRRQLEGWQLSRRAIVQQLESVTNARRRQMLEDSLAELDRRIRELTPNLNHS